MANPRAGNGKARPIAQASRRNLLGWECDFYFPTSRSQMEVACRDILNKNYDALLLLGGDGTLQSCLPLFLEAPNTPIGILPLGTANDLAAELQIEVHWEKIQEMLDFKKIASIDILTVNSTPFATIGGFGAGSAVLQEYNAKRSGTLAFRVLHRISKAQIYSLLSAKTVLFDHSIHKKIRIETGAVTEEYDTGAVFVCNQARLGKDLLIAPEARNDDGLFEILIIPVVSPIELFKVLWALRSGQIPKNAVTYQTTSLKVTSLTAHPIAVFGDGEILTEARELHFGILPRALKVFRFSSDTAAGIDGESDAMSLHPEEPIS